MRYATFSFSEKNYHLTFFGQVIAYFETAYPPFNRARLAQIGNVLMNVSYGMHTCGPGDAYSYLISQREALLKKELAAIRQPVLLIHGDKNQIHPIQHAHNMVADLINAKGGAKMYTIKGILFNWEGFAFARVADMVMFSCCL
jgi:pimeloyl-ACP methyl ester carboxylesterase